MICAGVGGAEEMRNEDIRKADLSRWRYRLLSAGGFSVEAVQIITAGPSRNGQRVLDCIVSAGVGMVCPYYRYL
jgi:hypothetical protein